MAEVKVTPRVRMRTEPWPRGTAARDCPVCGTWWRPWTGSLLPCHARCLFSREDRKKIVAAAHAPGRPRSMAELAADFGITTSVVIAILQMERDGR